VGTSGYSGEPGGDSGYSGYSGFSGTSGEPGGDSGYSGFSGYSGISGYSLVKGAGTVTLGNLSTTSGYKGTGVTMEASDVVMLAPSTAAAAAAQAADSASGVYPAITGTSGFIAYHPAGYSGTVWFYTVTKQSP